MDHDDASVTPGAESLSQEKHWARQLEAYRVAKIDVEKQRDELSSFFQMIQGKRKTTSLTSRIKKKRDLPKELREPIGKFNACAKRFDEILDNASTGRKIEVGRYVYHKNLGEGIVVKIKQNKVTVDFGENHGKKFKVGEEAKFRAAGSKTRYRLATVDKVENNRVTQVIFKGNTKAEATEEGYEPFHGKRVVDKNFLVNKGAFELMTLFAKANEPIDRQRWARKLIIQPKDESGQKIYGDWNYQHLEKEHYRYRNQMKREIGLVNTGRLIRRGKICTEAQRPLLLAALGNWWPTEALE
jgi:hypothetical protein